MEELYMTLNKAEKVPPPPRKADVSRVLDDRVSFRIGIGNILKTSLRGRNSEAIQLLDCRVGTKIPPSNNTPVILSEAKNFMKKEILRTNVLRMTGITPVAKKTVKDLVPSKRAAFTLAEVLITLGIIGVVAALTMPSVIEKHQKQVTVNKLKKVYSTLSQMTIRTYADNGPVSDFLTSGERPNANKTKQFFNTYWLPYFNEPIVANFTFYNRTEPFTLPNGQRYGVSIYSDYANGRILFSTQEGTIYFVIIMTWAKDDDNQGIALYNTIQQVYIDINGTKSPNKLGKDVFVFKVDFNNNIVKPYCSTYSTNDINNNCKKNNIGDCCADKIIRDGWQIKDDYPW